MALSQAQLSAAIASYNSGGNAAAQASAAASAGGGSSSPAPVSAPTATVGGSGVYQTFNPDGSVKTTQNATQYAASNAAAISSGQDTAPGVAGQIQMSPTTPTIAPTTTPAYTLYNPDGSVKATYNATQYAALNAGNIAAGLDTPIGVGGQLQLSPAQMQQYNAPSTITSDAFGNPSSTNYQSPGYNPAGASSTLAALTAANAAEAAAIGAPQTETPQEQKESSLSTLLQGLNDQEAGKSAYQTQENSADLGAGGSVDAMTKTVNDLRAKQQQILNAHTAAQLATQQGEGVTTAVDQRQRAEETRVSAIQSLEVSSLIAAAQGNLTYAQSLADKVVAEKFGPIEGQITAAIANLNLIKNDPQTTLEETNRANAALAVQTQAKAAVAVAQANYSAVLTAGVNAAANGANFTPTSQFPTLSQALTAISNASSPMVAAQVAATTGLGGSTKTGTWSTPYMLGGNYVQKNSLTGEVRTAVNPPNAPQPTPADLRTTNIGTALTDATAAIKAGAPPAAVRTAFLAKYPTASTDWNNYFTAPDTAKQTYPTPAPAASKGFNLFDPSTW